MFRTRVSTVLVMSAGLLFVACGDDTTTSGTVGTQPAATTATTPATTQAPVVTTTVPEVVEVAIWPTADVVFTTPEQAALDFLAAAFVPGPVIGPFAAGDARSGEFEVFASDEAGAPIGTPRAVLLVRQLGPDDGWFVLAAASDFATVTTPASRAVVEPGAVTVEGVARGFEATIVVSAFVVGDAATLLDNQVTMAGNFDQALPYSVTLDLSAASPGDVVVLLVRGGTGLPAHCLLEYWWA